MSLLIKALKKAEESQQERPGGEDAPTLSELAEELSLEPTVAHPQPGSGRGEEKKAEPPSPTEDPYHSAANLFSAKEPAESAHHNRLIVFLAIGAVLFLLGGGIYVYLAINKPGLLHALNRPAPAPASVAPPPPPSPAPLPEMNAGTAPEVSDVFSISDEIQPPYTSRPAPASLPSAVEPVREDDAIKVKRSQQDEISPELARAWQALQEGQLEAARVLYQRLLQQEPRNVDVLLGMAAIMARSHEPGEAGKLYLRALDIEPNNTFAQAGLLSVLGSADPAGSEARLKQLLAEQPAAFLHFALGNLYAGQDRWNEAQQAYFDAFRLEADNPDYAFNLAVSLEQLKQPRSALDYYQRALDLQRRRGAGFERATVEARIAQLRTMTD